MSNNEEYDYMHILPKQDYFVVKGYDTYPHYSVLAGQIRINFVDAFDTVEEAQQAYPDATMSHELLEPQNTFHHLEGEDL